MKEIIYTKVVLEPELTAIELARLPLSKMNAALDAMDADYLRKRSVESDVDCQWLLKQMSGNPLKAKINEKRNHYFIGGCRVSSAIVKKLIDKGYIRGH